MLIASFPKARRIWWRDSLYQKEKTAYHSLKKLLTVQ
jgi:hypothetical protein